MRAALILGGVGVLAAMEFVTPSRSQKAAAEPTLAQVMPEVGPRDTLTKGDRIAMFQALQQAPYAPPAAPVAVAEPTPPARSSAIAPQQAPSGAAKVAVVQPKPKAKPQLEPTPRHAEAKRPEPKRIEPKRIEPPRHAETRSAAKPYQARPVAEPKSCQANAFAGLIRALNLGCET